MNNRGYLSLELALILPIVLVILSGFILLTVYYHDFIMSKLAVNDNYFRAYFNDVEKVEFDGIVIDDEIVNSNSESFLFENNDVRLSGEKRLKVFSLVFQLDSSFRKTKVKKKTFVNMIDMGDNALSIFYDLKEDDKIKKKLKKIKSMLNKSP